MIRALRVNSRLGLYLLFRFVWLPFRHNGSIALAFLIARDRDVDRPVAHWRLHLGLRRLAVNERTGGHKDQRQFSLGGAQGSRKRLVGPEGELLPLEFAVSMRTHASAEERDGAQEVRAFGIHRAIGRS